MKYIAGIKKIGIYKISLFISLFFLVFSIFLLVPCVRSLIINLGEIAANKTLTFDVWNERFLKKGICGIFFFTLFPILAFFLHEYFISPISLSEKKKDVFCVLGISFLISIPLFFPGMFDGGDTPFHFFRIEEIANQLVYGHFPVRMQGTWCSDYGYPVSIYYGDVFLYFPSALKLAGFSLTDSYKIFVFFMNMLTVVISYGSFSKIFNNKKIGLLLALIFVTSTYRLLALYVRGALGEFCAATFFPLITLAVYRIYTEDICDFRSYSKNAVPLAVGMSLIFMTHILSTEMVCILLFFAAIFMFRKTFRKQTLAVYFIAIGISIFLSAGFLIPFFDYYKNVDVHIKNIPLELIQHKGVYLAQFFNFFQDSVGLDVDFINYRPVMTPGLVLMAGFIIGIFYLIFYRRDKILLELIIFFFNITFDFNEYFSLGFYKDSGENR